MQNTFATTTGNFECDPEHAGFQNTPRTNLQTNKAQETCPERTFMESSDRKLSEGSPLSRELGDAERITAAHIIIKGYKMHAKMNYRIKNGGRD